MTRTGGAGLIGTAAALLLFAAPAAGQNDEMQWLRNCERQTERAARVTLCELRLAGGSLASGSLDVDAGPNGGIVVRGGDVRDVEIAAAVQVQAPTNAAAQAIANAIEVQIAPGRIRSDGPQTRQGESWSVTWYITVPRRANLDLATVNGPVSIHEVAGRIRAATVNGPLTLGGLAGDVHARTRNGPLRVSLQGNRWEGAGLDAETVNGPVNLSLPEGYSAALEGGTQNGPLRLGIAVPASANGRRSSRFVTSLGSGGAPIRVVTTNGPYTAGHQ